MITIQKGKKRGIPTIKPSRTRSIVAVKATSKFKSTIYPDSLIANREKILFKGTDTSVVVPLKKGSAEMFELLISSIPSDGDWKKLGNARMIQSIMDGHPHAIRFFLKGRYKATASGFSSIKRDFLSTRRDIAQLLRGYFTLKKCRHTMSIEEADGINKEIIKILSRRIKGIKNHAKPINKLNLGSYSDTQEIMSRLDTEYQDKQDEQMDAQAKLIDQLFNNL